MPSAIPRVDISVTWDRACCAFRHGPHAPCPPAATWLVLHFCPDCDEPKRLYCRRHRDRHMPSGEPTLQPLVGDARSAAAGEKGEET